LNKPGKQTYGQILKSTALIGSSTVLNTVFGIVRKKVMAVLLGPAGIGLFGDYGSISDLVRTVAGMGVNMSGVRQIAEAVGTGDTNHIARTVTTLRRVALYSGTLGSLLLLIFRRQVSLLMFGNDQHAGSVALLALAVFFADVSAGQGALVQGMRRITDLARLNVLGAFFGTLFSIPIIYFWGERGVVPSIVCVAATGIITSWWYARKIRVDRVPLTWKQIFVEASALLKLGVIFMASGAMTMGAATLIRIILTRKMGLEDAGHYQAAWEFGGYYVAFILQAMGADFYPRLTAVANNNTECNRLVNEQAEVGVLLAGPGIIATLTFTPIVINLFYSAQFGPAVELLRWFSLGMILRVASWPMGFILVARGERGFFFWSELLSNLLYVALVWACVHVFGLRGAGIAFFGNYVAYWIGVYAIVSRLSGFRWSAANRRLACLFVPLVAGVFVSWYWLPRIAATVAGAAITMLAGAYSLKMLCTLIPQERFPRQAQWILRFFRLTPSELH
jgi:PST family polysaccharide transporter